MRHTISENTYGWQVPELFPALRDEDNKQVTPNDKSGETVGNNQLHE
jgi:hypothetical protein